MKNDISNPMYLTAGNFPSIAANTIQVAKMASAYTKLLPNLEVIALKGCFENSRKMLDSIREFYGLSLDLNLRFFPLLPSHHDLFFDQDYRPPKWFYHITPIYAKLRAADLIFTRKPETAITAVKLGLCTILETHIPWESMFHLHKYKSVFNSSKLLSIVVVAKTLADSFVNAGISEEKIIIEDDGVDLDQYKDRLSKEQARKELGLSKNQVLCIYTGHLYRDRGIEHIILSAKKLKDINFLIVGGWQKDIEYYKKFSKENNVGNINFPGFVEHAKIPLFHFAADILLMQYSKRTHHSNRCSPLKVFEYLAAGRPIISSDLPVLRSVLHNNENAVLVDPDSTESLTNAIKKLLKTPKLANKISKHALKDSTKFSWDARAKRILEHALRHR